MRPNSPPQMTSVSSSRPRCLRSWTSAQHAWSTSLHWTGSSAGRRCRACPSCCDRSARSARRARPAAGPAAPCGRTCRALARVVAVERRRSTPAPCRDVGQLRHAGLHAEGHLVLLDARAASPGRPAARTFISFSAEPVEHASGAPRAARPAGLLMNRIGSPAAAERHARVLARQVARRPTAAPRSPAPARCWSAWPPARRRSAGSRSASPGRSETHAPRHGRPVIWLPVCMNVMAGSWLIASVCMLRMKHMSSTILAVYGSSSLTHMPHLAVLRELVLRRRDREPRSGPRSSSSAAGPCGSSRAGPCRTTRPSSACSRTGPSATAPPTMCR